MIHNGALKVLWICALSLLTPGWHTCMCMDNLLAQTKNNTVFLFLDAMHILPHIFVSVP